MTEFIIELAQIIENLDNKWKGNWHTYDHERIDDRLNFIGREIQQDISDMPFCVETGEIEAFSQLARSVVHPRHYRSKTYKDGIQIDCYPNGCECAIGDMFLDEAMYRKVCRVFKQINDNEFIKVAEPIDIVEQDQRIVDSAQAHYLGENILPDVEPLEGQRSITDNAVWWITKAIQRNKGVKITDTKTLEGLNIILDKTGKKLYERRSLNCTRTEVKSLKEFLQQLLDSVPEPKN